MRADLIREYLRKHPDGARLKDIEAAHGIPSGNLSRLIRKMPDVYIDRWVRSRGGKSGGYAAVWCAVAVPENCPKPRGVA